MHVIQIVRHQLTVAEFSFVESLPVVGQRLKSYAVRDGFLVEVVQEHNYICVFILKGTSEGIFDFADAFSNYGVILIKPVLAKC